MEDGVYCSEQSKKERMDTTVHNSVKHKEKMNEIPEKVTITGTYAFHVGEMFQSFEELEKRLELHCSESLVYYWRRDTRTVKGAHTKTSRPIASRLKYYSLRYACVFGGEKKKSRSQGKRQNSKSLRNDCPSFIMLRASKNGQMLEVVSVCNEHNHDCSNYVNQSLPHTRKLPENIKQEVVEMMLMHIDRKKIIDYVKRKTNKTITVKDLFNLKAKYKNIHVKIARTKNEMLALMGLSPSTEECENDYKIEEENKEWGRVCYDENVIEYDDYVYHEDETNVEVDVEVQSDAYIEYIENSECNIEFEDTDADANEYLNTDENYLPTSIIKTECSPIEAKPEVQASEPEVQASEPEVQAPKPEVQAPEPLEHTTPQIPSDHSDKKPCPIQRQRRTRASRLKWFIQRENSRLKRRLQNCRICGTNSRFLDMQISVLQAEKQKLLEETSILRLTKIKLLNEIRTLQSSN